MQVTSDVMRIGDWSSDVCSSDLEPVSCGAVQRVALFRWSEVVELVESKEDFVRFGRVVVAERDNWDHESPDRTLHTRVELRVPQPVQLRHLLTQRVDSAINGELVVVERPNRSEPLLTVQDNFAFGGLNDVHGWHVPSAQNGVDEALLPLDRKSTSMN